MRREMEERKRGGRGRSNGLQESHSTVHRGVEKGNISSNPHFLGEGEEGERNCNEFIVRQRRPSFFHECIPLLRPARADNSATHHCLLFGELRWQREFYYHSSMTPPSRPSLFLIQEWSQKEGKLEGEESLGIQSAKVKAGKLPTMHAEGIKREDEQGNKSF